MYAIVVIGVEPIDEKSKKKLKKGKKGKKSAKELQREQEAAAALERKEYVESLENEVHKLKQEVERLHQELDICVGARDVAQDNSFALKKVCDFDSMCLWRTREILLLLFDSLQA